MKPCPAVRSRLFIQILSTHSDLYCPVRKSPLHQKANLFRTFGCIGRGRRIFALPDVSRTPGFAFRQTLFDLLQRIGIDAMALQFQHNATIAEAASTPIDQRLGKSGFRKKLGGFQPIEQLLDIVAFFSIAAELSGEFGTTVFACGEIAKRTGLQTDA